MQNQANPMQCGTELACTVYPMKYAHGICLALSFYIVIPLPPMGEYFPSADIRHSYFTGIGAIMQLHQYQSNGHPM